MQLEIFFLGILRVFYTLLFFSQPLYSQIFKGMVIAGGNLTQIDGDESTGYSKLGLNTGLGVMAALDKEEIR